MTEDQIKLMKQALLDAVIENTRLKAESAQYKKWWLKCQEELDAINNPKKEK